MNKRMSFEQFSVYVCSFSVKHTFIFLLFLLVLFMNHAQYQHSQFFSYVLYIWTNILNFRAFCFGCCIFRPSSSTHPNTLKTSDRQTPEEGQRSQRMKRCDNTNNGGYVHLNVKDIIID